MRLIVETARGGETVNATERQLSQLSSTDGAEHDLLSLVKSAALTFGEGNLASLEGPFIPCGINGARPVTYRQGVMYLSGQNKGLMLKCLLRLYQADLDGQESLPIRQIVFVDDTPKNVDNVVAAFKDSRRYTVRAFHYRALDAHKAKLTSGPTAKVLQARAHMRWRQIKEAISSSMQNSSFD